MTRDAILKCLTDRPCDVCVFHADGHCQTWNCVFEEKPDDAEADAISRISVLDTLDTTDEFMDEERTVENYKALLKECYEVLPPVTPKVEPCEDCISRKDVIDAINQNCIRENEYNLTSSRIKKAVESLPSVTPQQKMGHWVLDHVVCDVIYEYHCSACGHHLELGGRTIKQDQAEGYSLFCNGCGANMAESEE